MIIYDTEVILNEKKNIYLANTNSSVYELALKAMSFNIKKKLIRHFEGKWTEREGPFCTNKSKCGWVLLENLRRTSKVVVLV